MYYQEPLSSGDGRGLKISRSDEGMAPAGLDAMLYGTTVLSGYVRQPLGCKIPLLSTRN
jgi:hypothetical protein